MPDLSSMSDAELEAIAGGTDISKMSDAELEAIANSKEPATVGFTGPAASGIGSKRTGGFLGMFSIPNIVEGIYNAAKSAPDVTKRVMTGQLDPASEEGIKQIVPLAGLAALPSPGRQVARPAPRPVVPEDVAAAASRGYQRAEAAGATAAPAEMQAGLSNIGRAVAEEYHPELTPRTTNMVAGEAARYAPPPTDRMAPLTGVAPREPQPVPVVEQLQKFREQLNNVIQDSGTGNKDRAGAIIARQRVDRLMEQLAPEQAPILREAGANYGAAMRHEAIQNLETRALDAAGASNSGRNIENAIRQQVKAFIKPNNRGVSEAKRSGFTDQEINAMRQFTREGVSGSNLIRFMGNLLGGGGGLGSIFSGAALGPAAPMAGYALKSIGNNRTVRGLNQLAQDTLQRAPYAAEAGTPFPRGRISPFARMPVSTRGLPMPGLPPATLGIPALTERQ